MKKMNEYVGDDRKVVLAIYEDKKLIGYKSDTFWTPDERKYAKVHTPSRVPVFMNNLIEILNDTEDDIISRMFAENKRKLSKPRLTVRVEDYKTGKVELTFDIRKQKGVYTIKQDEQR